jgi:transglutaminase-like putative cysteine protease
MHPCSNCYTMIQDDVSACPYCGEVQAAKRKKGKRGYRKPTAVILVLCLLIVAGAGAFLMMRNRNGGGNANQSAMFPQSPTKARPTPTTPPKNTPKPTAPPKNTPKPKTYGPEPRTNSEGAYVISSAEDAETVLRYIKQNLLTEFVLADPSGIFNKSYAYLMGASVSSFSVNTDPERWTVEWPAGLEAFRAYQSGDTAALTDKTRYILSAANTLLQQIIDDGMSDLEKEYAIHDAIVNNCEPEIDPSKHTDTAEGFFYYGRCQCSGYVDTFNLLCRLAGLDTWTVIGQAGGGEHAWNLVKLDDKWYMVDVTWDDHVGTEQTLSHNYLNVPVSAVQHSHTWNRAQDPLGAFAVSFDDNHYVRRNSGYANSEQGAAELLYSLLSATAFKEKVQILYYGQVNESVHGRIATKMFKLGINNKTIGYGSTDFFDGVSVLTYWVE